MNKIKLSLIITMLLSGVLFGSYVFAQDAILDSENYSSNCIEKGDCEIDDFLRLLIVGVQLILGIVGSLALLFFVYGGVTFLISGGNSSQVEKGKEIIKNATIGLVLVFSSYMIVAFAASALGLGDGAQLLQSGWFK